MQDSSENRTTGIFFDDTIPQLVFAAMEIRRSLLSNGSNPDIRLTGNFTVESRKYETSILLALNSNSELVNQLREIDTSDFPRSVNEQGYSLRTTHEGEHRIHWVFGTGIAGAMYGGLRLAEIVSFGDGNKNIAEDSEPLIKNRGIKFNIPLDQRMPNFNWKGDPEKSNVGHMWDVTFWKEYLDELARNRYNVLSFWTKHPFTAMIKLPDFPDTEVHDVIDGYGKLVKKMSIDDKIAFWKEVLEYAVNRSIDIYYFTWNIYLNYADGKYGLSEDPKNEKTKAYLRECVREFLITYPEIRGIGITAGENMPGISFDGREKWLWDTYGKGIADVKNAFPHREITFIHRHWYSSVTDIMGHFEEYDDPFEFSFKYAKAHLHSSPDITFADALLDELPDGTKCWWTLRNDDIFFLRWGDPEYVRDFIRNFDKYKTAGYLMGSDGYVWGRTCNFKDPVRNGTLENKKHWYAFMLWGRLGYDPHLSDDFFKQHIKHRFPGIDSDIMYSAWKSASKIIPQITRFFWRDWDFEWYPEGCKGGKFVTVGDFMKGRTMDGSNIMNIAEYCRMRTENKQISSLTPPEIAARLEEHASETLRLLDLADTTADRNENIELRDTLGDIESFAWLGRYYSEKIRAATALAMYSNTTENEYRNDAVQHLEKALNNWNRYIELLDRQYIPRHLDRTGMMDWHDLTKNVVAEIDAAREFQPFEITISVYGAVDGKEYPAGADFSIHAEIESTYDLDHVMTKWNGESLGRLSEAPYIWKSTDHALLQSATPGGYEIGIVAFDHFGNSTEETIRFTVAKNG